MHYNSRSRGLWSVVGLLFISLSIYVDEICGSNCNETFSKRKDQHGVTKIQSYKHGDYNIQTLMTLTEGKDCNVVSVTGLLRVYAIKFAVQKINADKEILPNHTIGYEFLDGCRSLPITMARGIDIARAYRNRFCKKDAVCNNGMNNRGETIAVIGADYSYLSLPLASLLGLHSIPQISAVSSSPLLSSPTEYGSFFRTIPSDINIISVFIEILKFMDWKYVFAVGSSDDYGEWAISELKDKAKEYNICITEERYISRAGSRDTRETENEAKDIVQHMKKEKKAVVVIMFNYAIGMADYILREAEAEKLERFWLTSESWNPGIIRADVPGNQLSSVLTISLDQGSIPELNDSIWESVRNVDECDLWLRMLLKDKYRCNIDGLENTTAKAEHQKNEINEKGEGIRKCAGYNSLVKEIEKQSTKQVNNLIDAVYAVAHSLHDVLSNLCKDDNNQTRCLPRVDVQDLNNAMKKVLFKSLRNKNISFDQCGDIKSISYTIENLQKRDGSWSYFAVGNWSKTRSKKLNIDEEKIEWPSWSKRTRVQSKCQPPCQPGTYMVGKQGCCWNCRPCAKNMASNEENAETCEQCPNNTYTTDNIHCKEIKHVYLTYDHPLGIGILVITVSIVGILVTSMTAIGFFILRHKDIMKTECRPSFNFIIFPLLYGFFGYSPLYLIRPAPVICVIIPIYEVIALTQYTSLLFIQNNSVENFIIKIQLSHDKIRWFSDITLYLILNGVGALVLIPWQIMSKGYAHHHIFKVGEMFHDCESDYTPFHIIAVAFPYGLLAISTIVSFSNRYDVDHFEKPKFLSYTCIASSIVTVADSLFVTIATQEQSSTRAILKSLTMNCYGFIYIAVMLMPKLYNVAMTTERKISGANKAYIKDEIDRETIVAQRRDRNMVISTGYLDEVSDVSEEITRTNSEINADLIVEDKDSKTNNYSKKKESKSKKVSCKINEGFELEIGPESNEIDTRL